MEHKKEKSLAVTHSDIINLIAEKMGYDKAMIRRTINGFFSGSGVKGYMRKGLDIRINNFGTITTTAKRKSILKRKERVKRITERFKKNTYNKKIKSKL